MPFHVTIDLSDVKRALARGQRALERETQRTVDDVAQAVADHAKTNHPYRDRTTNLTNSIQVLPGPGLNEAQVFAGEEYASFVEEGTKREDGSQRSAPYPYMAPAAEAEGDDDKINGRFDAVAKTVEAAINRK